jgi:acetyl esterase/lipase
MPNVDRSKVGLMGDRAGGQLVIVLATLVRDKLGADLCPAPEAMDSLTVVGLFPLTSVAVGPDVLTKSAARLPNAPLVPASFLAYMWSAYAKNFDSMGEAGRDRRISPIQAGMQGMPHTAIVSAAK